MSGSADLCNILIAIFLPPLSVFLQRSCGCQLLINIILTCMGWIPGSAHAIDSIHPDNSASPPFERALPAENDILAQQAHLLSCLPRLIRVTVQRSRFMSGGANMLPQRSGFD
ncbi:UPF0057-domain-containing protein [Penicillium manginii]|uniref:UPF0057-domain-containing protein n=1 Tax=Penicillium manginii TaxID=203109 RepID=UPI00254734F2|nr:UPF0057-domain-containing protein [Penicillium manginii]KAJ5750348.1 UPF0057-domain-containing protein [Penicillium manginii]